MSQYKTITPPKGSLRSPITQSIVDHLEAQGQSKFSTIDLMLQRTVVGWIAGADPAKLGRVLNKLRESGHVHRVLIAGEMLWKPGPHPHAVEAAAEREAAQEAVAVVQASRFDVMRAPLYVPEAGPALRPGAMDYKRVPTVGMHC